MLAGHPEPDSPEALTRAVDGGFGVASVLAALGVLAASVRARPEGTSR
jgi:hypothetical protein